MGEPSKPVHQQCNYRMVSLKYMDMRLSIMQNLLQMIIISPWDLRKKYQSCFSDVSLLLIRYSSIPESRNSNDLAAPNIVITTEEAHQTKDF
ncbi:hypothetical protein M8J75_007726 [Diaphorina citri]|nr:hypothetical protein M8J75_007726 [Diaphorina citri]